MGLNRTWICSKIHCTKDKICIRNLQGFLLWIHSKLFLKEKIWKCEHPYTLFFLVSYIFTIFLWVHKTLYWNTELKTNKCKNKHSNIQLCPSCSRVYPSVTFHKYHLGFLFILIKLYCWFLISCICTSQQELQTIKMHQISIFFLFLATGLIYFSYSHLPTSIFQLQGGKYNCLD